MGKISAHGGDDGPKRNLRLLQRARAREQRPGEGRQGALGRSGHPRAPGNAALALAACFGPLALGCGRLDQLSREPFIQRGTAIDHAATDFQISRALALTAPKPQRLRLDQLGQLRIGRPIERVGGEICDYCGHVEMVLVSRFGKTPLGDADLIDGTDDDADDAADDALPLLDEQNDIGGLPGQQRIHAPGASVLGVIERRS